MLETLDQTDWSKLDDAYGPSVKTPGRIRNLASADKAKRDKALDDLSYTIYHQGSIYAASVAAVPFLLEIVASPEVTDRTPTLQILQALSTGHSYHEVHARVIFLREEAKKPGWQAKVREEKGWVAAIHNQLSAAVPLIARVLESGNLSERVAAVSLLATLQDNPAAVSALASATSDPSAELSAAAISAIGARRGTQVELLEQCFARAANELVRTVAAIQILYHRAHDAPPAAVDYLLNHLRAPQPDVRKAYEALPDVGAFLGDVGKALACGPRAGAETAFPLLYDQVQRSPYWLNDSETFGVLLVAVMMNPPPNWDWTKATLTQQQRLAIRMVTDRAWRIENGCPTTYGNLVDLLEKVGLPGKRQEIFTMLAGTPEGTQTPAEEAKWSTRPKRPWWRFW